MLLLVIGCVLTAGNVGAQIAADPFAQLTAAYARRDPVAAAAAYTDSAVVIYRYRGSPEERHASRTAIEGSFRALFDQFADGDSVRLHFRFRTRTRTRASGIYQLRVGATFVSYGRFTVRFAPDGRFLEDISTDATRTDFARAPARGRR